MARIKVGQWRDDHMGPMKVISGLIGRKHVHCTAPPVSRVGDEMTVFLDWFHAPATTDPVAKAAITQFWFVTIHLFDDGNGRIARAIVDLALTRSEGSPQRFYSISSQIQLQRATHYGNLERTQKGDVDTRTG